MNPQLKEQIITSSNAYLKKKNIFIDIMHPPLPRFAARFCSTLAWGVRIADGLKKVFRPARTLLDTYNLHHHYHHHDITS